MSEHYPRIRIHFENGGMLVREGLSFNFYMRRFHQELLPGILRSLETYRRVAGEGLGIYCDMDGEAWPLDATAEELAMRDLTEGNVVRLHDVTGRETRYRFEYFPKEAADVPLLNRESDWTSAVFFWLPTEYLEEHGPVQVRALALELASPLPFCSGQVGLSYNGAPDLEMAQRHIRKSCFRYPGLDIPDVGRLSWSMGTRVRGPAWLTFLGQPVLGDLGGAAGLRLRLHSPGTTVEELDPEGVVVTLGEWPEAGDTEQGRDLPAYRELARVLEPWLYHEEERNFSYFDTLEDQLRWERRFLD